MRSAANPLRLVNRKPSVGVVGQSRLARVQAHAHPRLAVRRPLVRGETYLSVERGGDAIAGAREGDAEAVPELTVLVAVVSRECGTHDSMVLIQDGVVPFAEPTDQRRRGLDVGEEKRDRPAWDVRHETGPQPLACRCSPVTRRYPTRGWARE